MYNDSLLLSYPNDDVLDDILTVADKEKDTAPIIRYLKDAERFHIASQKEEDTEIVPPVTGERKPADAGTRQPIYPPVLMPPQPEAYLKAGKYEYY
jgi:hypothetical protein